MSIEKAWIGITDKDKEKTWLDFDGNSFGQGEKSSFKTVNNRYSNFPSGEPNNYLFSEDFVVLKDNGQWQDSYKSHTILCQKGESQHNYYYRENIFDINQVVAVIDVFHTINFSAAKSL